MARLVASFEVGRLLNRLGFILQQAYFFADLSLRDEVRQVAHRLGIEARKIADPEGRDRLQGQIAGFAEWVAQLRCVDDHVDNLAEVRGRSRSPDRNLDSLLVELIRPVTDGIQKIRRAAESCLDAREARALRLGELLDQASRPPDIFRHLYVQDAPGPARGGDAAEPGDRACRPTANTDGVLANVARRPGEIPPRSGWFDELRQRAVELGIRTDWPPVVEDRDGTVPEDANDRIVSAVLEAKASTSPPPAPKPGITTDRLVYDRLTKTVVVDGREFHIKDPVAASIFEALYDARFEMVPTREIKRLPGCKGRHDKLIRKHLKDLAHIIQAKSGNGGGFWLALPPEDSP